MQGTPSRHRHPMMIIGEAIWQYHRFNHSYRDVREQLLYRGIDVSHETIRSWCYKFGKEFEKVIKKKQRKVTDKWHLDEMTMKVNGEYSILWSAVDSERYELDVFLQKRRNKKSAIRFLSRLLQSYPAPRVIITDKLKSYIKPIKAMCRSTEHRSHKRLNNRVENAHQPTRRKEKYLIKFKLPWGIQQTLSLMGKVRNIFAVDVGRYSNTVNIQREDFQKAKSIWNETMQAIAAA